MLKTANNEDENEDEDENDNEDDNDDEEGENDDEEARVKIKGYCHLTWDQATCPSLSFQP